MIFFSTKVFLKQFFRPFSIIELYNFVLKRIEGYIDQSISRLLIMTCLWVGNRILAIGFDIVVCMSIFSKNSKFKLIIFKFKKS